MSLGGVRSGKTRKAKLNYLTRRLERVPIMQVAQQRRPEVYEAAEKMLSLFARPSAVSKALSKQFGIGVRQANNYIAWVKRDWSMRKTLPDEELAERKARLRLAGEAQLQVAMKQENPRVALRALEFLADLDGLNAPRHVAVEGSVEHDVSVRGVILTPGAAVHSEEAVRQRVKELVGLEARRQLEAARTADEGGEG